MTYCRYKDYQKVCRLIAFGDSNTDTGNAFIVSKKILSLPSPPPRAVLKPIPGSWCKRASNGPLNVEFLANLLDVPLYNYSIGGAGTNAKNIFSWMNTFSDNGFLGQIDKYIKDLNGCNPCPNDLYSIYIGGNTTFTYRPPTYNLDQATTLAIEDIKTGLESLIQIGAKNFVVFNLFDLGLTPYSIENGTTKQATEFTNIFNEKLGVMLKNLKSTHP
ncbi:MAG: SGNH/GDSL hydrolase family protein, partial [Paraclostridium sp.]